MVCHVGRSSCWGWSIDRSVFFLFFFLVVHSSLWSSPDRVVHRLEWSIPACGAADTKATKEKKKRKKHAPHHASHLGL